MGGGCLSVRDFIPLPLADPGETLLCLTQSDPNSPREETGLQRITMYFDMRCVRNPSPKCLDPGCPYQGSRQRLGTGGNQSREVTGQPLSESRDRGWSPDPRDRNGHPSRRVERVGRPGGRKKTEEVTRFTRRREDESRVPRDSGPVPWVR